MLARLNELGITAIPKFDFSAAHDAWLGNYAKMSDTCAYREFAKKIIAEVCELFNYPEYFHLCMGDETVEYQKHYGLMIVRGPKAYWRDAYAMFDACRECGAKPIISGDSYYRDPLVFDKMIPDDVVIAAPYIELWGGRIENETDEFGRDPRSELQKKLETLTNRKNEFILVGKGLPTRQNLVDLFYFASIKPGKNIIGVMSQSELATADIFDYALLSEAMCLGVGKNVLMWESFSKAVFPICVTNFSTAQDRRFLCSLLTARSRHKIPSLQKNVQLLLNFVLIYCQNAKKVCFRSYSSRAKTRPLFRRAKYAFPRDTFLIF